jgi:hypothetical protein
VARAFAPAACTGFGRFAFVPGVGFGFARIAAATALPGGAAFGRLWPRATALPRAADFPRTAATGFETTDRFDPAAAAGTAGTAFAVRSGTLRSCTCCTPS